MSDVSISRLQAAHVERQKEWCPDQQPDLSFRGNEMAGETGEACNIIKKLERERHGWRGSRSSLAELADELADVVHTAVLCAITAGVDLAPAVVAKFNATSEKNGLSSRLQPDARIAALEIRLRRARKALTRVASPEAFTVAFTPKPDMSETDELFARMEFARVELAALDAETASEKRRDPWVKP